MEQLSHSLEQVDLEVQQAVARELVRQQSTLVAKVPRRG